MGNEKVRKVLEKIEEIAVGGIDLHSSSEENEKIFNLLSRIPAFHPSEGSPTFVNFSKKVGFVFFMMKEMAKEKGKDIYELSEEEVKEMISQLKPSYPREIFYFEWLFKNLIKIL